MRGVLTWAVMWMVLGSPTAAAGQGDEHPSNAELVATGQDTRSHDYHLVHQRIEVRDIDWDSTGFTGRVITTLVSRTIALDSVELDAGTGLTILRISDGGGHALGVVRRADSLVAALATPAAFGDTVRLTIDYRAHITNGHGLTFIEPEGRAHRPRQLWSQGEANSNHEWFPTYDAPNDKETWEVVATVPAMYRVVSNGRLVSDKRGRNGSHTVTWSQEQPASTYLVSLIVAPLVQLTDRWRAVPLEYNVYAEDRPRAQRLFGETPSMIDVYSRLTGVAYPWAKYAQTTVADFFGGMENVSATTLVDWLPDSAAYVDRPWYQYILIPHELAHQWFGDDATTENWANTWLNEGFATFMPGQYWGQTLGPHAEEDYFVEQYGDYLKEERARSMPVAALGSNNIYPKGALVLEMLKHYLGDARFWASMHHYLERHAFGSAATEDLREAVLETTGENLAWFWDEWLYEAGLPHFVVHAAWDSSAARVTVTVQQVQGDSVAHPIAAGDTGTRFPTPRAFRMPVTVRVGTADGDVVAKGMLAAPEQTILVDGIRTAPTMVVFDDGDAILKILTFDEPTAWLAEELRRDADLWDRQWALKKLGVRRSDTVAARALATAATGADYWLTRSEAVEALGAFGGPVATGAVEQALRDTSAHVRGAAVSALAQAEGADAIAALRLAWERDVSYNVRAAALGALIRLDSADRSSLIAAGLRTPSYLDVVQTAALRGMVATGDTTELAAVWDVAGERSAPLSAIELFARAGQAHAQAIMQQALTDPRPAVRRWAAAAAAAATAAVTGARHAGGS